MSNSNFSEKLRENLEDLEKARKFMKELDNILEKAIEFGKENGLEDLFIDNKEYRIIANIINKYPKYNKEFMIGLRNNLVKIYTTLSLDKAKEFENQTKTITNFFNLYSNFYACGRRILIHYYNYNFSNISTDYTSSANYLQISLGTKLNTILKKIAPTQEVVDLINEREEDLKQLKELIDKEYNFNNIFINTSKNAYKDFLELDTVSYISNLEILTTFIRDKDTVFNVLSKEHMDIANDYNILIETTVKDVVKILKLVAKFYNIFDVDNIIEEHFKNYLSEEEIKGVWK